MCCKTTEGHFSTWQLHVVQQPSRLTTSPKTHAVSGRCCEYCKQRNYHEYNEHNEYRETSEKWSTLPMCHCQGAYRKSSPFTNAATAWRAQANHNDSIASQQGSRQHLPPARSTRELSSGRSSPRSTTLQTSSSSMQQVATAASSYSGVKSQEPRC